MSEEVVLSPISGSKKVVTRSGLPWLIIIVPLFTAAFNGSSIGVGAHEQRRRRRNFCLSGVLFSFCRYILQFEMYFRARVIDQASLRFSVADCGSPGNEFLCNGAHLHICIFNKFAIS